MSAVMLGLPLVWALVGMSGLVYGFVLSSTHVERADAVERRARGIHVVYATAVFILAPVAAVLFWQM